MHPFDFTARTAFASLDPDACFVFEPSTKKFHWYGKELDKLGTYACMQTDRLILELVWNYGREQTYTVISFDGTGDSMRAFVLQNNTTGEIVSFSR